MNISSIVIRILQDKNSQILNELAEYCEVHHAEGNKLIATLEKESIDEEIAAIRNIEKIVGVSAVEMAFSYSENELEQIRNDVELQVDVPEWLNDESISAKQINYQGDLKKKF